VSAGPLIRDLGLAPYEPTWRAMQRFTDERDAATPDEIWVLQHPPVFTLGLNAKREHLLAPGDIPVIQIDRGGQVTYHGPGQLVVYPLIDLKRRGLGVRQLVTALENAVVSYAAGLGVSASASREAASEPRARSSSQMKLCFPITPGAKPSATAGSVSVIGSR